MLDSPIIDLSAARLSGEGYPLTRAAASDLSTVVMAVSAAYDGYASPYLARVPPGDVAAIEAAAGRMVGGDPVEDPSADDLAADSLATAVADIATAVLLRRGLVRSAVAVAQVADAGVAASDAAAAASAAFWRKKGVDALRKIVESRGGDPRNVKTAGYVDEYL